MPEDESLIPFDNAEEFIQWAGLKIAGGFFSGIGSKIFKEIWSAIFGSGKTAEQLLKEAVEMFAKKVEIILLDRDIAILIGESCALMHGLDNLSIRIAHNPGWWEDDELREDFVDELRDRESHASLLKELLTRERLEKAGWPTFMIVGSLLLRIYATRMCVPKYEESEIEIIEKDVNAFVNHHWRMCGKLREPLRTSFASIKKGNIVEDYSLRVPDIEKSLSDFFGVRNSVIEYCSKLDQNIVPDGLRQEFERRGFPLHSDVSVRVLSENSEWLITDKYSTIVGMSGERTVTVRYILRQENQYLNLSVYRLHEEPANYYDIVLTIELLQNPSGYWFEINTPSVWKYFEALSGVTYQHLFNKIPGTEYVARRSKSDDKLLGRGNYAWIRPIGSNRYWIYGKKWSILYIPESAGSAQTIRETLASVKYSRLYWLWSYNVRSTIGSLHDITVEWWKSQADKVESVAIRTHNGRYVNAHIDDNSRGEIHVSSVLLLPSSIFQLIRIEPGKIALRAQNKLYVAADLYEEFNGISLEGELAANKNWIGNWETFNLVEVNNNAVALRAANGKYVSATEMDSQTARASKLAANSNSIGPWETFEIVQSISYAGIPAGDYAFQNQAHGSNFNFEIFVPENERLQHYYRNWKDGKWRKGQLLGSNVKSLPAAFQNMAPEISSEYNYEIFVREGNHLQHHYRSWKDGKWRKGQQFGTNVRSAPTAFQNMAPERSSQYNYEVFVREGNHLQHYYRSWKDGRWRRGQQFGTNVRSAPAAFQNMDPRRSSEYKYEVFVREGNQLQHYYRPWKNRRWFKGQRFGGNVRYAPAVFQNVATGSEYNYEVFALEGTHVQHYYRNRRGRKWHKGQNFGSNVRSASSVFQNVAPGSEYNYEVFVLEGTHMQHYYRNWKSGKWHKGQNFS